jgi:hypothetical protein
MKECVNVSQKLPIMAISVSSGWAVRNFFQTGIIEKLKDSFRLLVFTTSVIHENLTAHGYGSMIDFVVREDLFEPLSWRLFRQFKKKLYLEGRRSSTEKIWGKYVKRPFYQKFGGKVIQSIVRIVDVNWLLGKVEDLDFAINNCRHIDKIFKHYKPCIFFATHASTYFEESLLHASIKNKIPTVFMLLSWDHLSSKVVLSRKYKFLFVWNKITKSEINETCIAYSDDQIKVVGVPQYDCYKEKPTISYEEWCHKYELDPAKRTILFSTMPQIRHEQQHVILENLLRTMRDGKKLPRDMQILIKCHPFDNTTKYDYLLKQNYPVGICRTTLPIGAPQEDWFPSIEEMFTSRDALFFCDININIFSTVTLEAAYFDKPIIHIGFDPHPIKNRIPCIEYYNFEHFKNITNSGASVLVENHEALIGAIYMYLNSPSYKADKRKLLVDMYFFKQDITAADAVVKYLTHMTEK